MSPLHPADPGERVLTNDIPPARPAADTELKLRIFAAFEHACKYGEVEVADHLLAIINEKWMKPGRQPALGSALPRSMGTQRMMGAGRFPGTNRTFQASR